VSSGYSIYSFCVYLIKRFTDKPILEHMLGDEITVISHYKKLLAPDIVDMV